MKKELLPFTQKIASMIDETIKKNDSKPAWEKQTLVEKKDKFAEELGEFVFEMSASDESLIVAERIISEGIDLIITVGHIIAHFDTDLSLLRRGRQVFAENELMN